MAAEPERHTFLFEPAVWNGAGTLWRADGEPLATQSRTEFVHRNDCWLLSGTLKVLGSPPTEFQQAYLIELLEANNLSVRAFVDGRPAPMSFAQLRAARSQLDLLLTPAG